MKESVLVTIGFPTSDVPILPFCKINVEESVAKAAKKLRKEIAAEPNKYSVYYLTGHLVEEIPPAELYWAAYHSTSDEKPFAASDNFWCRESLKKEYEKKKEEEAARVLREWKARKNHPQYQWYYFLGKTAFEKTSGSQKLELPANELYHHFYMDGWYDAELEEGEETFLP